MKAICKIAGAVAILFLTFIAEIPYISGVPEAQAFRGRGAAFVVGAAVGSSAASSSGSAAVSQQQAATAQQQSATAQQQAITSQQQAITAQQQAAGAAKK
jgi:hypothetical protein